MNAIEGLRLVFTAYGALWSLYLLFLVTAAVVRGRKAVALVRTANQWPAMAVIVPAGNAEGVIAGCLSALRACAYPADHVEVYVIADHCHDETAATARAGGAQVLIRDDGPRGKTYTIAWALDELHRRGVAPDLYVIVDATARVEAGFLAAIAQRWRQGEDIVSSHSVLNPENDAWYSRCLGLMLVHRNLQCWARDRVGLSALLQGCGMAYSQHYIERFGWSLALPKTQGSHPTEDWRHAVKAVEQGYRVGYADHACVFTPLRGSLSEATQQGARWERGRLINAGTYALRLLGRGLWEGDRIKVFAALDAMQPPVAILAALNLVLAAASYFFPFERSLWRVADYMPLILVGLYGTIVVIRGRRDGISPATALWAPLYLLWRCSAFILAWAFVDRVSVPKQRTGVTAPPRARSATERVGRKEMDDMAGDPR